MIAAIVDDLYVAASRAHVPGPGEGTGALPDAAAILRQAETGAIVSCVKSGYLQHIDHGALVAARARGGRTDRTEVPPTPIRAPR